LAALDLLGYTVARLFLYPITWYFVLTGGKSREASKRYLARLSGLYPAAPKPTWMNAYRHQLEFAHQLLDRALLWKGDLAGFHFSSTGKELLEEKRSTGCLLLGAHLGSFDVLRVLSMQLSVPVSVVMHRSHAPRINKIFQELNPSAELRVIELGQESLEGILEIRRRIDSGEHVAILADRLAPGQKQRIARTSFLGEQAPFPQNPWLIASLVGCPVLLVFAVRTGNRHYAISVEMFAEQLPKESVQHEFAVRRFAERLELLCRNYPLQWFNFYDFWRDNSGE
jgi:predicted LPLAT superfamily acyltransferase